MEIVRDYLDLKQAIPNQGTIGKVVFNRKNIAGLHKGHEYKIKRTKSKIDNYKNK